LITWVTCCVESELWGPTYPMPALKPERIGAAPASDLYDASKGLYNATHGL